MTRTNARELAAHLIFAMNYTGQAADETVDARLSPEYYQTLAAESETYTDRPNKKQKEYIRKLVAGVGQEQEALNQTIANYSVGWNIGRISRLSKTFMQIAIYESLYVEDVPVGVAINEAVVLTKKYDGEAAKFVNGILGSFAAELKEKAEAQNGETDGAEQ